MDSQYEYKKKLLLDRLRREMNGAVVDAMKSHNGLKGMMSYGVSLPTIKEICAEQVKDHSFALYLFNSNVRELKLCAVFLDEASKVNSEQIERWMEVCDNDEVMSNAAHLFAKSAHADHFFQLWIDSDSQKKVRLALLMAGSLAKEAKELKLYENKIIENLEKCNYFTLNSFVYAVTNILTYNPEWRSDLTSRTSESENEVVRELECFL